MEKLKLLVSGARVVSAPCHQVTVDPFDTDGLMNGGAVHGGMPLLRRNVGVSPLVLIAEASGSA